MRAGDLRTKLNLVREAAEVTYDSLGRIVPNQRVVEWLWAAVIPLTGQERLLAQQVEPGVSHTIRIRYAPGVETIDSSWWLETTDGKRRFEIASVRNVGEVGEMLELSATERRT